MSEITAVYFDGQRSESHRVALVLADGSVSVEGAGISRLEPIGAVDFSDRVGTATAFVRFRDGAFCEVADHLALDRALAGQGLAASRIEGFERSWRWALGSALLVLALAAAGYRYGLPLAAKSAAERLPPGALDAAGRQALLTFDRTILEPSALPAARRASIVAAFGRLPVSPEVRRSIQIEFRSSEALGANAMALPSGVIVVTDDLVTMSVNDDEVVGVLAHEVGHLARRHALRNLIQGSAISVLMTWYVGDLSALAAAVPTALLNARYSREFEQEADAEAVMLLRAGHIPTVRLADILERMQADSVRHGESVPGASYLSTHPPTAERVAALKASGP